MPFVITFKPAAMTAEQYDTIINKLDKAGVGNPKGRLYHVCYSHQDTHHVTDVWDTKENFDEFGKTLIPILQQVGVNPGEPQIYEVHNIIVEPAETIA